METEQKQHPWYPEWEEVETEQIFDKDRNIGMASCRECGLEGLVIGLHGLRISDRFSDRDKVLCGACIEEKKKKKTVKYNSFWTAGVVRRLQEEEDELDRLHEEEEQKRKLNVTEAEKLNVVKAAEEKKRKLFVTAVEKLNVATAAGDPKQQEELAKQAFIAFKIAFKKKEGPNVIVIE